MRDAGSVRHLVTLLAESGEDSLALATDGRIDVYGLIDHRELHGAYLWMLTSEVRGGPTPEQVRAGDYSSFAYERFRGSVSANGKGDVPLLWDREPRDGKRLVALNGARVTLMEEAELQSLLHEHGQVESDGTPQ